MYAWRVALLLLAALFVCAQADGVVDLTDSNFDELTATGAWLLDFYAPWCGHCKKLAPILDEAAEEIGGKLNFGKIDCTVEKVLQSKFAIKSYPTLIFMRDGEHRPYRGERERDSFLEFAEIISSPAVQTADKHSIESALTKFETSFIYCGEQSENLRVFSNAARHFQGLHGFLHAKDQAIARKHCKSVAERVVVLTEGVEDVFYDGTSHTFDKESLKKFVEDNQFPLISEISGSNFREVTSTGKLVIFAVTDPSSKRTKSYLELISEMAKKFRGKFVFANIDGIKFEQYVSQFGLNVEHIPIVFAFDYPNELYYPPPEGVPVNSKKNMEEFLTAVYEGKITARTVGNWWSPGRFLRWFENWLGQFSDMELAVGSGLVMLVLVGAIFWLFCTGNDAEESQPSATTPAKSTTGSDNGSKTSSAGGRADKDKSRKSTSKAPKIVEDIDKND